MCCSFNYNLNSSFIYEWWWWWIDTEFVHSIWWCATQWKRNWKFIYITYTSINIWTNQYTTAIFYCPFICFVPFCNEERKWMNNELLLHRFLLLTYSNYYFVCCGNVIEDKLTEQLKKYWALHFVCVCVCLVRFCVDLPKSIISFLVVWMITHYQLYYQLIHFLIDR